MNSLNIGFFLTLLFVGSIYSEDIAKHVQCLEKNNLSQEEFVTMAKAAIAESNESDDERMKCYTHCILESWGHLDENGKLDLSTLREKDRMTEEDIEMAKKCKNDNESVEEKCEYSYQVSTCIAKAMKRKDIEQAEKAERK
ncbi:general odorant-binding protein 57c-like [Musca autumnalis]|uniref:general odorant-binding protein 57c-like n=1 Tax=Musca autumnalis TaxID=221902 RepID=UPI003CE99E6D